jgi:hypothetical protein
MFLLDKNLSAKTLQQQREEEKTLSFPNGFLSFFLLSPISHIGLRQMVLFDRVLCSQIGLLFTTAKVSSLLFSSSKCLISVAQSPSM